MESIQKFLQEQVGVTDPYIMDAVMRTVSVRVVRKGEYLLEQGQPPIGLCFLLSGLLRGFFVSYDGKDVTDCFGYKFGTIAMPFGNMMKPSPISIEALETSTILVIPTQTMQDILQHSDEAVRIYNRMLLAGAEDHWEIKTALYQYSAAERYEWFSQRYEGLLDMVPHKHIATFLNMTSVTFSRLRRPLKEEKNVSENE